MIRTGKIMATDLLLQSLNSDATSFEGSSAMGTTSAAAAAASTSTTESASNYNNVSMCVLFYKYKLTFV